MNAFHGGMCLSEKKKKKPVTQKVPSVTVLPSLIFGGPCHVFSVKVPSGISEGMCLSFPAKQEIKVLCI